MGKADDRDMTSRPEPAPVAEWYGNWKLWFGAVAVLILGVLVYVAL